MLKSWKKSLRQSANPDPKQRGNVQTLQKSWMSLVSVSMKLEVPLMPKWNSTKREIVKFKSSEKTWKKQTSNMKLLS